MEFLYLDNNGTTFMHDSVKRVVIDNLHQGNPSGNYDDALRSRELIKIAKTKLMQYSGIQNNGEFKIIFTSGASESNNFVFNAITEAYLKYHNGNCKDKATIIVSAIEHKTTINRCKNLQATNIVNVVYINPNEEGVIDEDDVLAAMEMEKNIILVSIMCTNNETGNVNELYKITRECDKRNILFHSDIVASFGKDPSKLFRNSIKPGAVSISFHKLYGPTQCGALIIKRKFLINDSNDSQIKYKIGAMISGTQYDGYRGGTENISLIMGSVEAMRVTFDLREHKNDLLAIIRESFFEAMFNRGYTIIHYFSREIFAKSGFYMILFTNREKSMPHVANFCIVEFNANNRKIKAINNIAIMNLLLQRNIIISTGSACSKNEKSYVIESLGVPDYMFKNPLRISFGDINIEGIDKKKIINKATKLADNLDSVIKIQARQQL